MLKKYTLSFINYFIVLFVLLIVIGSFNETYAIPVFARKYKTSCATCHIAITKRNAFGEAFRRNGYVMPEKNARLIKDPPLSLGADANKEAFPDAVWPSSLPGSIPITAYTLMNTEYDMFKPQKGNQVKMNLPSDLGFIYGGTFGDDVSFFANYSVLRNQLYKLFIRFNSLVGQRNLINLKIGRFEPGITEGLPSNQLLTLDYMALYNYNPTGDWNPITTHETVELNGILRHNLQYNFGVSNSSISSVISSNPIFNKDYYGRIAYKFGGYGLDGNGMFADTSSVNPWRDDSFTFGLYGYLGNTQKANASKSLYNNQFYRVGADARLRWKKFDFIGGAMTGKDFKNIEDSTIKSTIWFTELDYPVYPWLLGIVRYEYVKSTLYNTVDKDKYFNLIPNITILYRLNLRLTIQAMFSNYKYIIPGFVADNDKFKLKWIKLGALIVF